MTAIHPPALQEITQNKSSFMVIKTSGGSKRSLQEALADPVSVLGCCYAAVP